MTESIAATGTVTTSQTRTTVVGPEGRVIIIPDRGADSRFIVRYVGGTGEKIARTVNRGRALQAAFEAAGIEL